MVATYLNIRMERVEFQPKAGFIELHAFFDYDFGIQINIGTGYYAFSQNGLTLTQNDAEGEGYGTLRFECGTTSSFLKLNEKFSITAKVKNTELIKQGSDGIVFKPGPLPDGNFIINTINDIDDPGFNAGKPISLDTRIT